jgi:FecR protein
MNRNRHMNEPSQRLIQAGKRTEGDPMDALEMRAGELLAEAGTLREWNQGQQHRLWRRIEERAEGRRSIFGPWLVGTVAGAAAMAGVLISFGHQQATSPWLQNPLGRALAHWVAPAPVAKHVLPVVTPTALARTDGWQRLDLGEADVGVRGVLEIRDGAVYQLPPSGPRLEGETSEIRLDSGEICAEIAHRNLAEEGPLAVLAPQFKVIVVGTHFCVKAQGGLSTVSVTEGRVRVEHISGTSAFVGAHETLRSDDARFAPVPSAIPVERSTLAPTLRTARLDTPTLQDIEARDGKRAEGSDLGAENALFDLGNLARDRRHDGPLALSRWRLYQQRFPDGVFAPEAAMGILAELVSEQRYQDALDESEHYVARFPQASNVAEVLLARGNLLREKFHDPQQALTAYDRIERAPGPRNLRLEALFYRGLCLADLGELDQAREAWLSYRKQAPQGAHAPEVERLLSR